MNVAASAKRPLGVWALALINIIVGGLFCLWFMWRAFDRESSFFSPDWTADFVGVSLLYFCVALASCGVLVGLRSARVVLLGALGLLGLLAIWGIPAEMLGLYASGYPATQAISMVLGSEERLIFVALHVSWLAANWWYLVRRKQPQG